MKKKLSAINYQPSAFVMVLLLTLSTVSGQTLAPIRKLPLKEPLETSKNMPPAPPRKIETSPRIISQFGVFTSYQTNVDASGNNILGDAANEPAIAVDPTDGDKQWFTIDTTGGTGHGFLYQFWTEFFACDFGAFNRSLDSGVTWQSPISPSNFTDTGALEVDINGNLFVGGGGSPFRCLRSSNAQNPQVTPSFDQNVTVDLGGDLIQCGINGIGLCRQTFVAVDRSGTNNHVYMLASVIPYVS